MNKTNLKVVVELSPERKALAEAMRRLDAARTWRNDVADGISRSREESGRIEGQLKVAEEEAAKTESQKPRALAAEFMGRASSPLPETESVKSHLAALLERADLVKRARAELGEQERDANNAITQAENDIRRAYGAVVGAEPAYRAAVQEYETIKERLAVLDGFFGYMSYQGVGAGSPKYLGHLMLVHQYVEPNWAAALDTLKQDPTIAFPTKV